MKKRCYLLIAMFTTFIAANEPDDYNPQIISNQTPYYLLVNHDPAGYSVEMDNGATWRIVDTQSSNEVKAWEPGDPLVIHPALLPLWSGARFFILNQKLGTTAFAEISHGPVLGKATHTQIVYIDYISGILQLQDGVGRTNFWRLNQGDRSAFQLWSLGQTIIIGSNENCYAGWFSNHPYILINVERNDYIRATTD